MKALSIKEPWLSMIASGEKAIETRTWLAPVSLCGVPLLLAGSKKPKGEFAGKAACIVEVVDCQPMVKSDEEAACCEVYPGAYAWTIRNIRRVWPVPIIGQLGIYEIPDAIIFEMNEDDPEHPTQAEIDRACGIAGEYELEFPK